MIGIYKYTNKINGKAYIGKSKNIEQRHKTHIYRSKNDSSNEYNSLIHRAFRKYGLDNFTFEILIECQEEELNKYEEYYIDYYKTMIPNGYNVLAGGQGGFSTIYLFNKEDILNIIDELKNTNKFYTEIAKEWDCSPELIKTIAYGTEYHIDGEDYPIRKEEQMKIIRSKTGSFTNENNPAKRLDDNKVKRIIDNLINTNLSCTEIAKKYNISVDQIWRINKGTIWTHIKRPIPCRDLKKNKNERVLLVANLLQNTDLTFSQIQLESGYKDRHSIQRINNHEIYKELLKDYPNPIRK